MILSRFWTNALPFRKKNETLLSREMGRIRRVVGAVLLWCTAWPVSSNTRHSASGRKEPCTHNRFGTDTVREGIYDFEGRFEPIHREMFKQNGYIIVRNLVNEEIVKRFHAKHFGNDASKKSGTPMCGRGCAGQPQRLKMHITAKLLNEALNQFGPGLFMALNLLKGDKTVDFSNTTDYKKEIFAAGRNIHSHNNVALPGAVFQNPHWDVANSHKNIHGMVLVDVPLVDVTRMNAPIEIWKGTQKLNYEEIFANPTEIVPVSNTYRQYWHCFDGMLEAAHQRPSAIIQSRAGDVLLRNPSTWHRGSPNNATRPRDMITILIQP